MSTPSRLLSFEEAADAARAAGMLIMTDRGNFYDFKRTPCLAERWRDAGNDGGEISTIYRRDGVWLKDVEKAKVDVVGVWAYYLSERSGRRAAEHALLALSEICRLASPALTLEEMVDVLCEIKKVCQRVSPCEGAVGMHIMTESV